MTYYDILIFCDIVPGSMQAQYISSIRHVYHLTCQSITSVTWTNPESPTHSHMPALQVGSAMDEVRGLAADLQHRAATLQHTLARALHVEPPAERRPELHISVAARPAPPPRLRRAGDGAGLGLNPNLGALYAALAVAGALGAAWAVRAASNARGRRAQGGRWVRDRSLGGRMVCHADNLR